MLAFNDLLHREGDEFAVWDIVVTFKSTNARKSPGWIATTLISYWSDSTNGSPINCRRNALKWKLKNLMLFFWFKFGWVVTKESTVFFLGVISKFVCSKFEGIAIFWVVSSYLFHVLLVLFVSKLVLLFGFVFLAVFNHIIGEIKVLLGNIYL